MKASDVPEVSTAEKARRFDAIQGAVIDFSHGRHIAEVWSEIVLLALPDRSDVNNDPIPPVSVASTDADITYEETNG